MPAAYLLRPNPSGVDWLFYSHSGTGEFFLVENRQNNSGAGYDDGLPGCGLLIWHIDESVTYYQFRQCQRESCPGVAGAGGWPERPGG